MREMAGAGDSEEKGARFHTTRWSVVIHARRGDAAGTAAMADLCGLYWYPLYAFVRRRGYEAHEAEDLTQSFFAKLLERDLVKTADPARGRFRSFLLKSLSNFLANDRERLAARKRGGGRTFVSIDPEIAEKRYSSEADSGLSPERLFDRRWALTVLEQAVNSVRESYRRHGNEKTFEAIKSFVTEDAADANYQHTCEALGITADAARAAVYRLRKRFRQALRETIAQTLSNPDELDDEIRDLFRAVAP